MMPRPSGTGSVPLPATTTNSICLCDLHSLCQSPGRVCSGWWESSCPALADTQLGSSFLA